MLVIGLTGGIGCGKSTVANEFAKLGIDIIDSDLIARDLVERNKQISERIKKHFGSSILTADKKLNRTKLREIVFYQPKEKYWLEKLLHPQIYKQIKLHITNASSSYCIVVIPLLLETQICLDVIDRILVVDTTKQLQIKRAQQRDHNDIELVKAIMKTQVTRKQRLAATDDIIHNKDTFEELHRQVLKLHHYYLQLSR